MLRRLSVWVIEFLKLIGRRQLHPLVTQCPVCQQMVRLHVNKAGRRHVFAHARELYEGSRCGRTAGALIFDWAEGASGEGVSRDV